MSQNDFKLMLLINSEQSFGESHYNIGNQYIIWRSNYDENPHLTVALGISVVIGRMQS